MDENLVGYLLGCLETDERREVERRLAEDAELRRRLETLRQALEPLALDRTPPAPPPGLVVRTLARVAEHTPRDLPHAPVTAARAPALSAPFWRRADFLVAASLLFVFLGLGIPAVYRMQQRQASLVACQNNLREFFGALSAYHEVHGQFPHVAQTPRKVAGMVVPMLREAGVLSSAVSVRCPSNGDPHSCPLTVEQLRSLDAEQFQAVAPQLIPCYAYSLGYRGEGGYLPPRRDSGLPNASIPLLADAPPNAVDAGVSRNHGGSGQNVLFQDGHVAFFTRRTVGVGEDDIYLNRVRQVAAGLDNYDAVLGASAASP